MELRITIPAICGRSRMSGLYNKQPTRIKDTSTLITINCCHDSCNAIKSTNPNIGFRIIAMIVPIVRYREMILFNSLLHPWAGRFNEGVTVEFKLFPLLKMRILVDSLTKQRSNQFEEFSKECYMRPYKTANPENRVISVRWQPKTGFR